MQLSCKGEALFSLQKSPALLAGPFNFELHGDVRLFVPWQTNRLQSMTPTTHHLETLASFIIPRPVGNYECDIHLPWMDTMRTHPLEIGASQSLHGSEKGQCCLVLPVVTAV